MSTDLEDAVEAYAEAVLGADLAAKRREAAARAFRDFVARITAAGAAAWAALEAALADRDAERRNAAARALLAIPDPRAAELLLAAWSLPEPPVWSAETLRHLGTAAPLPEGFWELLDGARPWERPALVFGLLRRPSPRAEAFFRVAVAGADPVIARAAVEAAAGWGEPELLWQVIRRGVPPPADLPPWLEVDVRLDAAFHLGLAGDREAVAFLESRAADPSPLSAARAGLRLAWLAWPGAVAPTAEALRAADPEAVGIALDAAAALRAAALGPVVSELAARSGDSAQRALQVLASIAGEDADTGRTAASRLADFRRRLRQLRPGKRYHRGLPLKLAHLAAELSSPHAGLVRAAAYNLRTITGEDHGFDTEGDLIGNLDALEAWRARASLSAPAEPGGWAFSGRPLPGPEAPP